MRGKNESLTLSFANVDLTANSYDLYGQKIGSFKKDSSGIITEYDKYVRKAAVINNFAQTLLFLDMS